VIPIGIMNTRIRKRSKRVCAGVVEKNREIGFEQNAVDMGLVKAVWKAQGSTPDHVLLVLESSRSHAPKWEFEHR
jgi:hypothetical protein